jgi:hypothetical protein
MFHTAARRLEVDDMTADTDIAELCREALEEESGWRGMGADGRKAAFDRFQHLLHKIAELTGRTYEDVLNDAVEEWLTIHFCAVPGESEPSAEWRAAAHADPHSDAQP